MSSREVLHAPGGASGRADSPLMGRAGPVVLRPSARWASPTPLSDTRSASAPAPSIRRIDPQLLHLLIQRIPVDPQEVGGLGLDAAALGQRPVDQGVLDLVD